MTTTLETQENAQLPRYRTDNVSQDVRESLDFLDNLKWGRNVPARLNESTNVQCDTEKLANLIRDRVSKYVITESLGSFLLANMNNLPKLLEISNTNDRTQFNELVESYNYNGRVQGRSPAIEETLWQEYSMGIHLPNWVGECETKSNQIIESANTSKLNESKDIISPTMDALLQGNSSKEEILNGLGQEAGSQVLRDVHYEAVRQLTGNSPKVFKDDELEFLKQLTSGFVSESTSTNTNANANQLNETHYAGKHVISIGNKMNRNVYLCSNGQTCDWPNDPNVIAIDDLSQGKVKNAISQWFQEKYGFAPEQITAQDWNIGIKGAIVWRDAEKGTISQWYHTSPMDKFSGMDNVNENINPNAVGLQREILERASRELGMEAESLSKKATVNLNKSIVEVFDHWATSNKFGAGTITKLLSLIPESAKLNAMQQISDYVQVEIDGKLHTVTMGDSK